MKHETTTLQLANVSLEAAWWHMDNSPLTLVLLHEGLGCIAMWKSFPEQLAEVTGCTVFAYSRQGYGLSSPCEVPRPLTYMHKEAIDVLPLVLVEAGIEAHILVGHSDGGSISLVHAGSTERPNLKAVITMAAHVFNEPLTIRSIEKSCEAYTDGRLREGLARYHFDNVDCAFWGWNKAWLDPGFVAWNLEEYLPTITVPLLIIQGDDDPYGTVAQVEAIQSQAGASSQVEMITECAHSPHKEQAEVSLNLISDFLVSIGSIKQ